MVSTYGEKSTRKLGNTHHSCVYYIQARGTLEAIDAERNDHLDLLENSDQEEAESDLLVSGTCLHYCFVC